VLPLPPQLLGEPIAASLIAVQPPPAERPPEPPPRAAPQIPSVGDVFTGRVTGVDESAVLVEVPGFAEDQAIGVIKAETLGGKRFAKDNMARVEVISTRTLKSGRTIVELKPGPKAEKK
jgi:exosome complex RNA-binding protein Csl4